MPICKTCKFYHICKGKLNETVSECVRYKSAKQTNEEWFTGLSTEKKAEVLNDLYWEFERKGKLIYDFEPTKESYELWLKQPHTPKE